jgi:hypothetical protein
VAPAVPANAASAVAATTNASRTSRDMRMCTELNPFPEGETAGAALPF